MTGFAATPNSSSQFEAHDPMVDVRRGQHLVFVAFQTGLGRGLLSMHSRDRKQAEAHGDNAHDHEVCVQLMWC
jgi:hypothetical protein